MNFLKTTIILATALGIAAPAIADEAANGWPLPQPTTPPPAIPTPRDVDYPGTIGLEVDATDALRGIHRIHETVPVSGMKQLTLLFPQWIPGDPVPPNALDQMAGLVVRAGGETLKWLRDPAETAAFHIDVPVGATAVDVDFQFLVPASQTIGPVLGTPLMMDLQWQSHVLYPAGYYARRIRIDPSVKLPKDWLFASSLDGARRVGEVVRFARVSLDSLVDSPVMAARWLRQYSISEDPVPVRLDVAAETEAGLAVPAATLDKYRRQVAQAYKLFGGRHYDHFDLMVWLSNGFGPSYFEQGRSGENARPADFFSDEKYASRLGGLFHGYVHAWNGMFRMPATMWTANLNTAPQDSMLWVFEGLTMYWGGCAGCAFRHRQPGGCAAQLGVHRIVILQSSWPAMASAARRVQSGHHPARQQSHLSRGSAPSLAGLATQRHRPVHAGRTGLARHRHVDPPTQRGAQVA